MLVENGLFNLATVFRQILENLTLLGDTSVLLALQVNEILLNLILNGLKLIVEALNSIRALLLQQVLQVLHAVVASFVFGGLVVAFGSVLFIQVVREVCKLLVVLLLVGLQRVIDFLALVDCELFDVFDLSVELVSNRHPIKSTY